MVLRTNGEVSIQKDLKRFTSVSSELGSTVALALIALLFEVLYLFTVHHTLLSVIKLGKKCS